MPYQDYINYSFSIARGIVGHTSEFVYGVNGFATGTSVILSPWPVSYSYPSTNTVQVISSSSNNDATSGSGAINVTIEGLDYNYADITENVAISGQTPKTLTSNFLRINRLYVNSVGALNVNDGRIYIYADAGTQTAGVPTTTTEVYGAMSAGSNYGKAARFTIPAGCTGYILKMFTCGGDQAEVRCVMKIKQLGGLIIDDGKFIQQKSFGITDNMIPIKVPARSDISIWGYDGNTLPPGRRIGAGFELVIIDGIE